LLDAKTTNIRNNSSAIRALEATHFAIDTLGKFKTTHREKGSSAILSYVLVGRKKNQQNIKWKKKTLLICKARLTNESVATSLSRWRHLCHWVKT